MAAEACARLEDLVDFVESDLSMALGRILLLDLFFLEEDDSDESEDTGLGP